MNANATHLTLAVPCRGSAIGRYLAVLARPSKPALLLLGLSVAAMVSGAALDNLPVALAGLIVFFVAMTGGRWFR